MHSYFIILFLRRERERNAFTKRGASRTREKTFLAIVAGFRSEFGSHADFTSADDDDGASYPNRLCSLATVDRSVNGRANLPGPGGRLPSITPRRSVAVRKLKKKIKINTSPRCRRTTIWDEFSKEPLLRPVSYQRTHTHTRIHDSFKY